jgi:hypothetical protein
MQLFCYAFVLLISNLTNSKHSALRRREATHPFISPFPIVSLTFSPLNNYKWMRQPEYRPFTGGHSILPSPYSWPGTNYFLENRRRLIRKDAKI